MHKNVNVLVSRDFWTGIGENKFDENKSLFVSL